MVKRIGLLCVCVSVIMLNMSGYVKAEDSNAMNLKQLTEMLVKQSVESEQIDLNIKLLDVKYEQRIKDYDEFKSKKMDYYGKDVMSIDAQLTASKEALSKTSDQLSRSAIQDGMVTLLGNYNRAKMSYKNLADSYISLTKTVVPVLLQKEQAERQKTSDVEKLKFNFQKDYYSLMTNTREAELSKKDLENVIKQIEVENVKLGYGMSTSVTVDDLERQKRTLENAIKDLENTIQMTKETMKTKLNIPYEEELKVEFAVPEIKNTREYAFSAVMTNFSATNIELETIHNNTQVLSDAYDIYKLAYLPNYELYSWLPTMDKEDQEALTTAELELKKAQNDETIQKRNMELYVKQTYFQYKKAALDLQASIENRKFYEQKRDILKANYEQGQLSKLQYDLQSQEIDRRFFDSDKAAIAFENARIQLEMTIKGIYAK